MAAARQTEAQRKRDKAKVAFLKAKTQHTTHKQMLLGVFTAAISVVIATGDEAPVWSRYVFLVLFLIALFLAARMASFKVHDKQIEYEQEARSTGVSESEMFSL